MESVSLTQLKARLSFYLRKVREGRRFLLSDRGRSVAVLGPVTLTDDGGEEAHLTVLERAGLVRAPEAGLQPAFCEEVPQVKDPKGHLRKLLR